MHKTDDKSACDPKKAEEYLKLTADYKKWYNDTHVNEDVNNSDSKGVSPPQLSNLTAQSSGKDYAKV